MQTAAQIQHEIQQLQGKLNKIHTAREQVLLQKTLKDIETKTPVGTWLCRKGINEDNEIIVSQVLSISEKEIKLNTVVMNSHKDGDIWMRGDCWRSNRKPADFKHEYLNGFFKPISSNEIRDMMADYLRKRLGDFGLELIYKEK